MAFIYTKTRMSVQALLPYLPENTLPFLRKWFGENFIHIKVTKGRETKLGDYRKMPDGSHQITVNSTLQPELFFFVLTHELAHMIAFLKFGRKIAPHGTEWKITFREMLLESIMIYNPELQKIILEFSRSPKANFMASPDLVRYFQNHEEEGFVFVETLKAGERFVFRNQKYAIIELRKKNYLCKNLENGKNYAFRPLAKVEKLN